MTAFYIFQLPHIWKQAYYIKYFLEAVKNKNVFKKT